MLSKLVTITGLAGVGATVGGVMGGLVGILGTGAYSFFYIIPYFTAQTQSAPEWLWVAVVIALIPSAIVVLLGLVIGVVLGALVLGLLSMLLSTALVLVSGQK